MTKYRYHDHPSGENKTFIDGTLPDVIEDIARRVGVPFTSIRQTDSPTKAENGTRAWVVCVRRFTQEIPTYGGGTVKSLELAAMPVKYLYL